VRQPRVCDRAAPADNPSRIRFSPAILPPYARRYSHDRLRKHLAAFVDAYNYGKRLKSLKGLTPFEYIPKCWKEGLRLDLCHFQQNGFPRPK